MKLKKFLYDRRYLVLVEVVILALIDSVLYLTHIKMQDFILINIGYIVIHCLYFIFSYKKLKSYFSKLLDVWDTLEEKNMICEFIEKPEKNELKILYNIIIESGLTINNKLAQISKTEQSYREYIEQLVHEIKLPISVIKIIADKNDTPDYHSTKEEIEKIEGYIEQVLYYARSSNVENDFFITETDLYSVIRTVLKKHRNQLISKDISISLSNEHCTVLTDGKWLGFIISQLLDNAIKYSDNDNPEIKILTYTNGTKVTLSVMNNGLMIPAEDIGRLFDKGFTGQNGRNIQHSTGMGLYLVKYLSAALGHSISVKSENGFVSFDIEFNPLS